MYKIPKMPLSPDIFMRSSDSELMVSDRFYKLHFSKSSRLICQYGLSKGRMRYDILQTIPYLASSHLYLLYRIVYITLYTVV